MSEEEFAAWVGEKTRAEWIDGEITMMAPVSGEHDLLAWWLRTLVQLFSETHKLGEVRGGEFMIRLARPRRRRIPDVLFVRARRAAIVGPRYVDGPPDLVMEVVSLESVARDWREKYAEYQAAGVQEYWIIDPRSERIEAYTLTRKKRYQLIEPAGGKIHSGVLKGFYLRPEWLDEARRPSALSALKELGIS